MKNYQLRESILLSLSLLKPQKRVYYKFLFHLSANNPKRIMKVFRGLNKNREFTVPRHEIPWNPIIDIEKCVGCSKCIEFCPKNVFRLKSGEDKVIVKNPSDCVFWCKGCTKICNFGAITFPERKNFVKYIRFK